MNMLDSSRNVDLRYLFVPNHSLHIFEMLELADEDLSYALIICRDFVTIFIAAKGGLLAEVPHVGDVMTLMTFGARVCDDFDNIWSKGKGRAK